MTWGLRRIGAATQSTAETGSNAQSAETMGVKPPVAITWVRLGVEGNGKGQMWGVFYVKSILKPRKSAFDPSGIKGPVGGGITFWEAETWVKLWFKLWIGWSQTKAVKHELILAFIRECRSPDCELDSGVKDKQCSGGRSRAPPASMHGLSTQGLYPYRGGAVVKVCLPRMCLFLLCQDAAWRRSGLFWEMWGGPGQSPRKRIRWALSHEPLHGRPQKAFYQMLRIASDNVARVSLVPWISPLLV